MTYAKKILTNSGFFMVSKPMCRALGFDASVMLAILADCESLHGKEFYQTVDQISHFSHGYLGEKKQREAIKILVESGCVDVWYSGMPRRRHFKINMEVVEVIMSENA